MPVPNRGTLSLDGKRDIGVAVGILVASRGLTRDQAFDVLRTLRKVARSLVETGKLPS